MMNVSRPRWAVSFFYFLVVGLCFLGGTAQAVYYPNMNYGPKRVLAPGVTWQTATHASPAWSIQIFEVDMGNPNVELVPVFKSAGNVAGSPNERTSSMAARTDAIAAVNAGYYDTSNLMTNSYTMIDGQFIGGSSTLMRPENGRSVLGFSADHQSIPKRTKLSSSFVPADSTHWDKITDAIAGRGHFVAANGVLVTQDNEGTTSSHNAERHPRTVIGYSMNPYRAWLVTVDGRQTGFSVGMTYLELGRLMADLGVEQSISLDGGGSTTAWVKGVGVVNSVSGSSERSVVSAWAVTSSNTLDNTLEEVGFAGHWATDFGHPEQYYLNHQVTSSTAGPASATWTPDLARNGLYKVYAWWASSSNRTSEAPYEINHRFGTSIIRRDQRMDGGQWNFLGAYPFRAGTEGSVRLANTAPGTLSADAVRFVFYREEPRLFWEPTEWKTVALDDFDLVDPIAFDPVMKIPAGGSAGNTRWERDFNYGALTGPLIPVPPGGNGVALRTAANNLSPATEQLIAQTYGSPETGDSAVEALLLGYLADNNIDGSTTWGGIGIRMSDTLGDGYFVQQRVDDSASFGHYLSFYRTRRGERTLLGRYYYRVGTGGILQGVLGDSRAIRSPQQAAVNQWVPVRLEAVGNVIALFLEDMANPVAIFADPDPVLTGKALLYHEDPFGSSLTVPADSSGTFFETFRVDVPADPLPPLPPVIESLEFPEGGGARVVFAVAPNETYLVEASSDLVDWVSVAGTHVADAEGQLMVEDPEAGDRRFWRVSPVP